MIENNKAIVRRFIDEVFVKGNATAVDELVAKDFAPHTWPGVKDAESLKQAQKRVLKGLSDVRFTVEDMIAEGDRVAVRLTAHAIQTGEMMGMPASNKP